MVIKRKNIISLAIILIPFYGVAIMQKILLTKEEILVEEYLGFYMLMGIIGISTILIINKYLLNNTISIFRTKESKIILDLALSLLLLSIFYFIKSIEDITYGLWISTEIDRTSINNLLDNIFNNTLFSIIIIGPFNWINEAFLSLSVVFILYNFWEMSKKKSWIWITVIFTGFLIGLLNYSNGFPAMISSFIIIVVSSYTYYNYRSFLPLFIAGIMHQTIDLISYWIYM